MNFASGADRRVRGVRYRPDTGFEMRCGDCRVFWPLDREFWNTERKTLQRCRGCEANRNARARRAAYRANREVEIERQRDYDARTRTSRYRECPKCGNEIESRRLTRAYCNACHAEYMADYRARKAAAA
jgi:hypothetical protein